MIEYGNLKYARRAGSDVMLVATIRAPGNAEDRGGTRMRRLDITDGHTTLPLVIFGECAGREYRAGRRIRVGPVYWSEQWSNFSLARGGTVSVS